MNDSSELPEVVPGGVEEARLYAAVHGGTPGDVEQYASVCEGAGAILELGCGVGRVLVGIGARGEPRGGANEHEEEGRDSVQPPRIVGMEHHPGMVSLAREAVSERSEIVLGDIADFDLGEHFERVLIPYSGFWCLATADKARCLSCVRRHLAPGGELHFDVYDADELVAEAETEAPGCHEDEFEWLMDVEVDGAALEVFEQNRYWFSEQRMHAVFEYREAGGGRVVSRQVIEHHYMVQKELVSMLEAAGFDVPTRVFECDGQVFWRARGVEAGI